MLEECLCQQFLSWHIMFSFCHIECLTECFPQTCDLNSFKSRIKDTFYFYVHSKQISCMFQSFVVFIFLLTTCFVAAVQTCMKRMPFFKKTSTFCSSELMYTKYIQIYPTFQQTFVYILHKSVEMLRYILFTFWANFVYQLYTYKIYTYFLFGMLKLFDLPIANREARKPPLHFYRQPLTFKRKP